MSHYSLLKLKLKNVDISLLKEAVERIALEEGGQIVTSIEDYYGNRESGFIIAIKTPTMHRGVGVNVDEKGQVQVKGDFFQYEGEKLKLMEKITQYYTASALSRSLSSLGYRVQQQKQDDRIVVKAYAHS